MKRYFTPVHGSSEDEVKNYKHYQPISHRHPHYHHYHHSQYHNQGSHSHSSSSSHGKHSDHHHDNRHNPYHHGYSKVAGDHHSYTKTSSSSLSSSSSPTSSASWTSEPSLDDETYLMHNKPQHSLSCSNISQVQKKICEDYDIDHRGPLHSQNQRQRHSIEHSDHLLPSPQYGHGASKLCRGHSKSEEGLQQNRHKDSEESDSVEHGTLYKTASLGNSLALSGNVENILEGRGAPKKAVSSIQLPCKGILKNKDEGQNRGNFRKSKSMEVLSTRVHVTSKESSIKATKHNIVKEKLQFSAFLDEITRQIISPSKLSSLGVTIPTSPKSPNEERKQYADKIPQESVVPTSKQQPIRAERPDSGKTGTDSSSCSLSHKKPNPGKQHQSNYHPTRPPPTPPRHPSKSERRGATSDKHHYRQYSQLLTDGTSASPEPMHTNISKHKESHQSTNGPARKFHTKQEHKNSTLPPYRTPGSSTSASSEKSNQPKHMGHRKHSRAHRDSVSAVDKVQFLEQYNKELHENLLQMVSCIENIEAELQCTKTELSGFKEKYKRLQESYSVSQQANSVLEQKLKSMVDSLDSERKYLLQRVMDLTKQLDSAQKIISSLENINVPSLIRELLKKPFDSQETLKNVSYLQPSLSKHDTDQSDRAEQPLNNQPSGGKMEERVFEWPQNGCSDSRQQPAAAVLPWKHDHDLWAGTEPPRDKGSDSQLLFSVADGLPIHKVDAKPPTHQAHQFGMNTEINIVAMPTHRGVEVSPNPHNLNEIRPNRQASGESKKEGTVTMRKDPNDFTYLTAQMVLDNFLSQIPSLAHGGEVKDGLEAVIGAKELAERD